jgi:hypothetical protein
MAALGAAFNVAARYCFPLQSVPMEVEAKKTAKSDGTHVFVSNLSRAKRGTQVDLLKRLKRPGTETSPAAPRSAV